MLINPRAQQRVVGFEAEVKKSEREVKGEMILLFSVFLWRFRSLSMWVLGMPVRIKSGVGVGWDGIWFLLGFVSLSPLVPLPVRKLARAAWPPSGGYGYGNQVKNRTQDDFHSLQLPLKKEKRIFVYFLSFFLAPGRNGLFCSCLKYTKHVSWWKVPLVPGKAILPEPKENAVHEKLFC